MDKVVHFEIPADDMARAKKFYSGVFGWKTEDVPGMEYSMVHTVAVDEKTRMPKQAGAINGGMMKRGAGFKTPVLTIDVADIDKALQKVEKAGGKVVKAKEKVMDMGWVAYFTDSEGNVTGVWQSIKPM
jgi:predicted enzyme related to lactoylglutathione lyase